VPTYQYACTECGNAFEAVQSFSDDALTDCPACNGRLRKVFSSVGIVFKGSGFYRNDSREAAKDATSPADKNGADKGDKGDKGGASPDKKEKAGSTAGDSGTKTSDSPSKSPPASTASTPSTAASSGSKSSSTAGSAA